MIEPGQILDKYELLEKVGQGGMAVVYRGIDRSLKREVAVKVLHHHLAEHPEARNRFEREAQAVAKLRHENILEIFDFSGTESEESYIVTEFIDGQTLKQFISERSLRFPEVGAMICAEICGALTHAHGLGILHRDIKPENIMVRSDGVLKLMDFGIAQMLDTDRLTVTGQLLGSPAYMSPEHVEGKRLDFRTDVFSVGILLYQLTTGDLPFKGRNPHEILKRIAECEYPEPSTLNARVGRELTGIIKLAMAREKDDRYRNVGEMRDDLMTYLEGSGLEEPRKELKEYFKAPSTYEIALQERLLSTLTRHGRELLRDNKVRALEYFDRVLTIDPDNKPVLAEIDRLSRRQRGVRIAALFGAIAVLGGGGLLVQRALSGDGGHARPLVLADIAPDAGATEVAVVSDAAVAPPPDAAVPPDAARRAVVRKVKRPPRKQPDAGVAAPAGPTRTFVLHVSPEPNAQYRIDNKGAWRPYARDMKIAVGPGRHTVSVRNKCCIDENATISETDPDGKRIAITTPYRPATLLVTCGKPNARAQIDGRPLFLDRKRTVPISQLGGVIETTVQFDWDGGGTTRDVTLKYGETTKVQCD